MAAAHVRFALAAVSLSLAHLVGSAALAQEQPFRNVIITETLIGNVPAGKYAFKASVSTVDPGGEIPSHTHKYPGLRYMLEGALTIRWKGQGSQTFSAGSTYFEPAGENHPDEGMSATNPLGVPARVLIIELVPVE